MAFLTLSMARNSSLSVSSCFLFKLLPLPLLLLVYLPLSCRPVKR